MFRYRLSEKDRSRPALVAPLVQAPHLRFAVICLGLAPRGDEQEENQREDGSAPERKVRLKGLGGRALLYVFLYLGHYTPGQYVKHIVLQRT